MKKLLPLSVLCAVLALGCGSKENKPNDSAAVLGVASPGTDPVVYSFVFVGCNRVQYGDQKDTTNANPVKNPTDRSSANLAALSRIYGEIAKEKNKPDLFFFLGDMVCAEEPDTITLHKQLAAWVKMQSQPGFNQVKNAGIEMVTVPGNHEMLFYNTTDGNEYPEKGATGIWMRYMNQFIPANASRVSGPDSINNLATFSFVRNNIAFVVMNTDTYNDPPNGQQYGHEGLIPSAWINAKVKQYRADKSIDHIFVLGHKPYYLYNAKSKMPQPNTGHEGLWKGPDIWPTLENEQVAAMLSAHYHDYQRLQPGNKGTYQIVAGNGGSQGTAAFFGYSRIDILQSGKIQLVSKGYDCVESNYMQPQPQNPFTTRDSTILSWTANANPYPNK